MTRWLSRQRARRTKRLRVGDAHCLHEDNPYDAHAQELAVTCCYCGVTGHRKRVNEQRVLPGHGPHTRVACVAFVSPLDTERCPW